MRQVSCRQGRRRLALGFLALGAAGAILSAVAVAVSKGGTAIFLSAAILGATVFAAWRLTEVLLLRRTAALAAAVRMIAHGGDTARLAEEDFPALAPLPAAVNELVEKLFAERRRVEEAVAQSTARSEEQKSHLAAILNDLHDGVLVCNLAHQILLYNRRALSLLGLGGTIGLGRSLLSLIAREPLLHALERLRRAFGQAAGHAAERHAEVVTATADGRSLLRGRMGLLVVGGEVKGYVLTLADATAEFGTLGKCDALLREATESLRQPIADIRAAAETLADPRDLSAAERTALARVIREGAQALSDRIESVSGACRELAGRIWPTSAILSTDLTGLVAWRAAQQGITVQALGPAQWLRADSYSLALLFGHLIARLRERTGATVFELATEAGGSGFYLDLSWPGAPVTMGELSAWLEAPLEGMPGGLTAAEVLRRHESRLWSEAAGEGRARLRMPLAAAAPPEAGAAPAGSRPEFFDFDLLHQPLASDARGRMPLDKLTYVVFDTETTGLNPSGGDALLAIGAVRIVNGRILTGETFSALIHPKRSIPPSSIRFHGITDEMVRDCPPVEEVLPAFRAFVDDAVLVAHNAAFDLKFLRLAEKAAGVRFDGPVLDTMVLSRFLQGEEGEHSLDALAERLGVQIVERHSALGDAMATAAIFLRFIAMLKERGIETLDEAIRRSNMQMELIARGHLF